MTSRFASLAAATLALAACGSKPEVAEDPATTSAEVDPGLAGGTIPERFHGVWDNVEGNCELESHFRIEVSATNIRFSESRGSVTTALTVGDTVIVDLEMNGEGETWTQKSALINVPGSDELTFQPDAGEPSDDPTYVTKRCL